MSEDVKVVVDVHEPDEIGNYAVFHPDVDGVALNQPLESADIIVNGVGFERKEPSDYASSLKKGRLDRQVEKGKDAFDRFFILVEGDVSDFDDLSHTDMSSASLRGSVASYALRDDVHTVFCGDAETLVDMAVRYGRKFTEAPSRVSLPTPDVGDTPTIVKMLCCVDGVGLKTAEAIAEDFDSVPLVREAVKTGALQNVDGVGPATAESIREAWT